MTSVKPVLTYQDYLELPNDGRRYEIVDGELTVTPAPGRRHQGALVRLASELHGHVSALRLGKIYVAPFDVILAETAIVQPDIIFVANDRQSILSDRGVEGAPTLVIEILSSSTARSDRGAKRQLYARYGVPWYWLVDPDRRAIEMYRHAGDAFEEAGSMLGEELVDRPPFLGLRVGGSALWDE